ncbi:OmpH family outer membrane protein [bacterium]|nr:OmpH family outer membrane protein [bacterium]
MKKLKLAVVAFLASLFIGANAFADTVGVLNYKNVLMSYNYAKETIKLLDNKETELQQYMLDKEKQYKNLANPVERKSFEEKVQREYKSKVDALSKMRVQKEEEIFNNIMAVAKRVATQKKIDVIVDSSVVLTGGIDITNEVVSGLNNK